jgi:hypothetical protein
VNSNQPRDTSEVCADRIVCAGRLEEGGDKRIREPSSRTGVLGDARWEGLTTLGREASGEARWPRATAPYKGDRNRSGSDEESAGFIVPLEGMGQHNPARGEGTLLQSRVFEAVEEVLMA